MRGTPVSCGRTRGLPCAGSKDTGVHPIMIKRGFHFFNKNIEMRQGVGAVTAVAAVVRATLPPFATGVSNQSERGEGVRSCRGRRGVGLASILSP